MTQQHHQDYRFVNDCNLLSPLLVDDSFSTTRNGFTDVQDEGGDVRIDRITTPPRSSSSSARVAGSSVVYDDPADFEETNLPMDKRIFDMFDRLFKAVLKSHFRWADLMTLLTYDRMVTDPQTQELFIRLKSHDPNKSMIWNILNFAMHLKNTGRFLPLSESALLIYNLIHTRKVTITISDSSFLMSTGNITTHGSGGRKAYSVTAFLPKNQNKETRMVDDISRFRWGSHGGAAARDVLPTRDRFDKLLAGIQPNSQKSVNTATLTTRNNGLGISNTNTLTLPKLIRTALMVEQYYTIMEYKTLPGFFIFQRGN